MLMEIMDPLSHVALIHCRRHRHKQVTGFYSTECTDTDEHGNPIKCLKTPMDNARWHQVSSGQKHTCGILDEDRTLQCWGYDR